MLVVDRESSGCGGGGGTMVANGSEPREILLDPMSAGSRGADGCEFDLEVDRECSPRVERLEMIGLAEEPA